MKLIALHIILTLNFAVKCFSPPAGQINEIIANPDFIGNDQEYFIQPIDLFTIEDDNDDPFLILHYSFPEHSKPFISVLIGNISVGHIPSDRSYRSLKFKYTSVDLPPPLFSNA